MDGNKQPSDRGTPSRGKAPSITVIMTASAYMVPRIVAQNQEALIRPDTLVKLILEGSEAKPEPNSCQGALDNRILNVNYSLYPVKHGTVSPHPSLVERYTKDTRRRERKIIGKRFLCWN